MDIEDRLNRLERQNRQLRAGFLFVVLGMVCIFAIGAKVPKSPAKRVEAGEFVLVDGTGKERGALRVVNRTTGGGVTDIGAGLTLTDSNGTERLELGYGSGSVSLEMRNLDGKAQVRVTAMSQRMDVDFHDQASISLRHENGPGVELFAHGKKAHVVVTDDLTQPAAGAKMYCTSKARGFAIDTFERVSRAGHEEAYIVTQASLLHEANANRIRVNDRNGEEVWSRP